MPDMFDAMTISSHGLRAQGERTRVIAENIANSNTAGLTAGSDPYSRKVITFKNEFDREYGYKVVNVEDVTQDKRGEYPLKFMPDHPGANESGYVKMPNVKTLIEMNDMKEAQRSYEANLGMIEQSRGMMLRTIDMLR